MQTPLQITLRHMAQSQALTTRVRDEARKLSAAHPDIFSCRVVIEQRDRHKSQGRSFNVRIVVGVAGHELIANHDHDEDVYVALRDAFASLTRRLEDVVRRQRDTVEGHPFMSAGEAASVAADRE